MVDFGQIEDLGVDGLQVQCLVQLEHLLSQLVIHIGHGRVLLLLRLILVQVVYYGLQLDLAEFLGVSIEPIFYFWRSWQPTHIYIKVVASIHQDWLDVDLGQT